jgi:hypothetical protein
MRPRAHLNARLQAGQRARFDNPPPELLLNRLPSMVAPCAPCPGARTTAAPLLPTLLPPTLLHLQ